jgi:hypothetical protein
MISDFFVDNGIYRACRQAQLPVGSEQGCQYGFSGFQRWLPALRHGSQNGLFILPNGDPGGCVE